MTATSGEAGLKLARRDQFSIVLVDLAMPGMSGLEVAARIREFNKASPIVLITGWEVDIDAGQLDAAGIDHVLRKPFRIEQLTDLIGLAVAEKTVS